MTDDDIAVIQPFVPKVDWLKKCQRKRNGGEPLGTVANVLLALRHDRAFALLVRFDEMRQAPVIMHPLGKPERFGMEEPRPLRDDDVTAITEALQHAGLRTISETVVHSAIVMRARESAFNPLVDYLNRLKWDSVARLEQWLHFGLGADDTPYNAAVGRMFLISMVARALQPGCKVDTLLVLEGEQGAMKSMACRALAGDKWFSDGLPNIVHGSKDCSQHLRDKWLIELAEIHHIQGAHDDVLKSFLTRQEERYRPPYGRYDIIEPRRCVFVGTTNEATYLRDPTGARRFWPVAVGTVDLDWLRQQRGQLLAEAVIYYRVGKPWWPDAEFEREVIEPEQEARHVVDPWEDRIEAWLCTRRRTTIGQIMADCLELDEKQRSSTRSALRVRKILRQLKWKYKRMNNARWYLNPILGEQTALEGDAVINTGLQFP